MATLPHDFRIALRFLRRNPVFTTAAVAILAIGIGLGATLYAIVRGALIEPWPYRGYDRIVTVAGNYPTQGRADFSLWSVAEIEDFERLRDVFEHVIAGDARNANLTYAGRAERVRAAVITPNAFTMLDVPALAGRALREDDARAGATPVVVASYQFWQTRLGADPNVVGRTLRIGDTVFTIVGVMPRSFVFWNRDLWMPLRLDPSEARTNRRYYMQAQLRPGVTPAAARARLRLAATEMATAHPDVPEYDGLSVTLNLLVESVLRDLRPTLYLLLGAVVVVLLVTTANLANATLAKAMARESELAIRRAIGGSTSQLARQLLIESGTIGIAGGLAGAAAAAFLLPRILALIPFGYVPAEARVELDWRLVALSAAAAAGFGMLTGLLPAVRAAAIDPALLLKQSDTRTGSRRRHWWRDGFVAAQLTLAVVVLGVAAAAVASLRGAVERDPGYRADGIWTARIALPPSGSPERAWSTYQNILRRVAASDGVADVALASLLPVGALPTMLVSAETTSSTQRLATLDAATMTVSTTFFRLLDIPILEGRGFEDADESMRPAVAVVTRVLSRRLWADGSAIGKRVAIGSRTAIVVGVAGDIRTDGNTSPIQPAVFVPAAQQPPAAAVLALRISDGRRALAIVGDAVRAVNGDMPVYQPETLTQARVDALGPKLLAVALLGLFAATVLTLSAVGVYAVVSQSVQERGQELWIRLAFGADPRRLFVGELARAARVIVASTAVGATVAVVSLRALASAFEGFAARPGLPIAASACALVALALVATAVPAARAVRRGVLPSSMR